MVPQEEQQKNSLPLDGDGLGKGQAQETSPNKLYLVDGSSFIYRAFYALPKLTNGAGDPTGAIYGVTAMLRKLLAESDYSHIAVIFDPPGRTVRHEWYADYKVNRMAMPDDLKGQVTGIFDMVDALGLPRLQVEGHEADDVIASYARSAASQGWSVVVITGDKDLCQLVDERIVIWNPQKERLLDREGVYAQHGVWPEQIVDYLALIGDSSDDIPGVPKVGPKTAAKWLAEYQNLTGIIAAADSIKGKVGESLRAHLDQLALSHRLVQSIDDLPLPVACADLRPRPRDAAALVSAYQRWGFNAWLKEMIDGGHAAAEAPVVPVPRILGDASERRDWWQRAQKAGAIGLALVADGAAMMEANLLGVALILADEEPVYLPWSADESAREGGDHDPIQNLAIWLRDQRITWWAHDWKWQGSVLVRHGLPWPSVYRDILLLDYVMNPDQPRHDLERLALNHLHLNLMSHDELSNQGMLPLLEAPGERLARYAGERAFAVLALSSVLGEKLAEVPALATVLTTIELPLVPILAAMERAGVGVDQAMLRAQSAEMATRIREIEAEAVTLVGQPFNLASPKQLQAVLFELLQLPVIKKSPKGKPSTDIDVLAKLAEQHPLPRLILEHRHLAKLKSTYTDRLPEACHPQTHRVHCQYHQAVTSTGRLSSSQPNLQNIPIRTELGRKIRRAFVAPPGQVIVAADYSQIELRLAAHYAQDPGLLRAFAEGRDVHAATAAELFDVAVDQVTPGQRSMAKTVNFGLLYGMSVFGLARNLAVERSEAQAIYERYFERYPGVAAYIERVKGEARERGYVETLTGRRLHLTHINDRNALERQAAERLAINAPLQGSAADIIKLAMIAVDDTSRREDWPSRLIMQVHDELVFEMPVESAQALMPSIAEQMSAVVELTVPLEVTMGMGRDWEQAH